MYMFNDMELLVNLGKFGILKHILSQSPVTISNVKLAHGYSHSVLLQILEFCPGVLRIYSDEGFYRWKVGRGRGLSIGDLDTLYLAQQGGNTIILSEDDFEVKAEADKCGVPNEPIAGFIRRLIRDEQVIKMFTFISQPKQENI